MDLTKLTALISLIFALSIASERLVEIIKGFCPYLSQQKAEPKVEGKRLSSLQILAVASAIFITWLASDYLQAELCSPSKGWSILGLGLLASGGSGFWNSIITYFAKVKDVKSLELAQMKKRYRCLMKCDDVGIRAGLSFCLMAGLFPSLPFRYHVNAISILSRPIAGPVAGA